MSMLFTEDLLDRREINARVQRRRNDRKTRQAIRHRIYEAERATEQERRADIRTAKFSSYFE